MFPIHTAVYYNNHSAIGFLVEIKPEDVFQKKDKNEKTPYDNLLDHPNDESSDDDEWCDDEIIKTWGLIYAYQTDCRRMEMVSFFPQSNLGKNHLQYDYDEIPSIPYLSKLIENVKKLLDELSNKKSDEKHRHIEDYLKKIQDGVLYFNERWKRILFPKV